MKRGLIAAILMGLITVSYSSVMAEPLPSVGRVGTLEQEQQQQAVVKKLIGAFNHANRKPLSQKQLKSFYSPAVTVSVNGEQKAAGYKQLGKYLGKMLSPVKRTYFSMRADEVIVAGENVVAHYYIRQQVAGHWKTQQVMANFIFDHGKISQWSSVTT
ncbi:MAG: hypothetical protein P1U40_12070 [Coxiellaceae bacterium]|nr:hypothetical protein [Coxiellaceae bacterium]